MSREVHWVITAVGRRDSDPRSLFSHVGFSSTILVYDEEVRNTLSLLDARDYRILDIRRPAHSHPDLERLREEFPELFGEPERGAGASGRDEGCSGGAASGSK